MMGLVTIWRVQRLCNDLHMEFGRPEHLSVSIWVLHDIDLSVCCTLLRPVGGGVAVPAGLLLFCPSRCVVSPLNLSSPASITSKLPCQSLPDRLHRPDAKTPPKHKSSFRVQGTLQLALRQTTPWASEGTGWSLSPQPWCQMASGWAAL